MKATVVFACVRNAGRSQIAAAFFDALADPAKARAVSAGTKPAGEIHPEVVETMREVGIDLAARRPRLLTKEVARGAALLVTMGCGETCPSSPGVPQEDWPLEDPAGRSPEAVRGIREAIRLRVADLVGRRGWGRGRENPRDGLRPSGPRAVDPSDRTTSTERQEP